MKVIQSSGSSQWFSWSVFHISVYGCFFSSTQKPKIPHNASVNLDALELSADLTDSTVNRVRSVSSTETVLKSWIVKTWRGIYTTTERAVTLVKIVPYFGEFGYLHSSWIRRVLILCFRVPREINLRFCSKTQWHVDTHLDGDQSPRARGDTPASMPWRFFNPYPI